MLIADAQIHLWTGSNAPAHHWRAPFTMDDALREMDAASVDRAINCPAVWDPQSNDYAVEAATRHPGRFATLGFFDITMPAREGFIERYVAQQGMLGLRFLLSSPERQEMLRDRKLDWIWEDANRLELPVGVFVRPESYDDFERVASTFPKIRFLIDHLGFPANTTLPDALSSLDGILKMARHPNIAVKATGVPGIALDEFPWPSIHGILKRTFDAFGPDRMFWGTDFTRMSGSWADQIRLFTEELHWLRGGDLENVMGRGICSWIGWQI